MARPLRDPANQLYDDACELLAAAQALRADAARRESVPGLAATLGCLEASLDELASAVTHMRVTALAALDSADSAPDGAVCDRLHVDFARLSHDLSASQASSAAARQAVGPVARQKERYAVVPT